MAYTMYGIPNCNSVKKAKDYLATKGVEVAFHDYKKNGIDADKLAAWIAQVGWEKLLNKAGTTWRSLSEEEKQHVVDATTAQQMMLTKTSLIKRPLLEDKAGKVVVVGFKQDEFDQVFS